MKRLILLFTCALLSLGSLQAAQAKWLTNYQQAVKQAETENKTLVLNFTGSDWCTWCIRLDKEVFSKKEFVDYANSNLVLVKLDFPQNKKLSSLEKKQNSALAKKHNVSGYPTILILDSKETKLGQLGYQEGGPAPWLESLKAITKK